MRLKLNFKYFTFLGFLFGIILGIYINSKFFISDVSVKSDSESIVKLDSYLKGLASNVAHKDHMDSIVERVIEDIFKNLDPHSLYIPDTLNRVFMEEMAGEFEGIGIRFSVVRDTVTVLQVIEGGPSHKVGLLSGDQIMAIGSLVLNQSVLEQTDITKLLKGPSNTSVKVTVYRKFEDKLIDFEIVRDRVDIPSITSSYMIDSKTGYIKIEQFSKTTFDEFTRAVISLSRQNIEHLVVDLRNNPGGLLDQAVRVSDFFLPEGSPIVIVESNKGQKTTYNASEKDIYYEGHLYLLVNEISASASEILAGAIQDNDRGLIIGHKTYGKGLVQLQTRVGESDFLRLTTSRFYTPTGRSIQKPYPSDSLYANKSHFIDSLNPPDSAGRKEFITPKGRELYGGGGIDPDILIEEFASIEWGSTPLLNFWFYNTFLIESFLLDQIEIHKIPTIGNKAEFYSLPLPSSDEYFQKFVKYMDEQNLNFQEIESAKAYTLTALKAHIGRLAYGEDIYYRIKNTQDIFVQTALKEILKIN